MPARNEITTEALQRLARLRADGPVVLSAYLDLDPERFATAGARESEVRSLIDSGHRQIEPAELTHEQHEQLRADLDRVESYLSSGEVPSGAHGLAVFCCSSLHLFETLSLPEPVETVLSFDVSPHIAPLAEIGPPGHWCVTLVNRRVARIMRGSESMLVQVAAFGDRVHGQHSQGGWSQAHHSRSVEHDVEAHLRHTSDVLLSQQRRRPFAGLFVAAPQELRSTFEGALHPYVRERLVGWLDDLDVETSTEDQVRARAAEAIAHHNERRLHEKLERLRAELGRDGRAAAGAEAVLSALLERRVEALLFTQGQPVPGAACPTCGLLSSEDGDCPQDGARLEHRDDVLEQAIEAAVAQDAEVLPVTTPDLGPIGGIAALLRF
jgi:peptide chain release factor subunit 1